MQQTAQGELIGMVSELVPGDLFYLTEGDIKGHALCIWITPKVVHVNVGGGTPVSGREVGYLTGGHLVVRAFRSAKEVVLWRQ